jgi:hypothetical protein
MLQHFVIDPLISKRQQLLLATQLCRMVLKVRISNFWRFWFYTGFLFIFKTHMALMGIDGRSTTTEVILVYRETQPSRLLWSPLPLSSTRQRPPFVPLRSLALSL